MTDHLSASQINLYLDCSLKYRFLYIDRIPRPFTSSGLLFGKVVHSTLEWLSKERKKGNSVTLERLFRVFEADWFSQTLDQTIRYKEGEEESSLKKQGRELLSLYFHREAKKPVAAELPFQIHLVSQDGEVLEVPLQGFIDLVEEGGMIVEFKTSQRKMDEFQLSESLQLTAYSYAYELLFQKKPEGLRVINLVRNRNPKIEEFETKRENGAYQRLFLVAKKVLEGIQAQIFFPRTSFFCKDCEFEEQCRNWTGQ
jgi:putative RecB family exonuclease